MGGGWGKRRGGCLPDDPQAVRGDPLALLTNQPLLPSHHEQLVKAFAGAGQAGLLKLEHGHDLAIAVHALLVRPSQANQAHTGHRHQSELDHQTDHAADELTPFLGDGQQMAIGSEHGNTNWIRRLWAGKGIRSSGG